MRGAAVAEGKATGEGGNGETGGTVAVAGGRPAVTPFPPSSSPPHRSAATLFPSSLSPPQRPPLHPRTVATWGETGRGRGECDGQSDGGLVCKSIDGFFGGLVGGFVGGPDVSRAGGSVGGSVCGPNVSRAGGSVGGSVGGPVVARAGGSAGGSVGALVGGSVGGFAGVLAMGRARHGQKRRSIVGSTGSSRREWWAH
ncbi:unnamed protein product [Closterium sp. Naga37s-1]|nr:unnamed protein product [Closterium sp. Naga37s-1]